jgi:hypothetical protein
MSAIISPRNKRTFCSTSPCFGHGGVSWYMRKLLRKCREGRRGARTPNSSLVCCKNKCSLFIFFGRNPVDVPSDTKFKTGMRLQCRSWRGRTARQLRNAVTAAYRDHHDCGAWSIAGQLLQNYMEHSWAKRYKIIARCHKH